MGVLYEIIRRAAKGSDTSGRGSERTIAGGVAEELLRLSNRKADQELLQQYGRESRRLPLRHKPDL
ncbi:hypothetical protein [Paenibacillus sp. 1P07SE]|uniref:hypothetical protein n=1 Tax=Paenibacillus sp. 1P07SE TaxID=3132209 RepID=UPI0039A6D067